MRQCLSNVYSISFVRLFFDYVILHAWCLFAPPCQCQVVYHVKLKRIYIRPNFISFIPTHKNSFELINLMLPSKNIEAYDHMLYMKKTSLFFRNVQVGNIDIKGLCRRKKICKKLPPGGSNWGLPPFQSDAPLSLILDRENSVSVPCLVIGIFKMRKDK